MEKSGSPELSGGYKDTTKTKAGSLKMKVQVTFLANPNQKTIQAMTAVISSKHLSKDRKKSTEWGTWEIKKLENLPK